MIRGILVNHPKANCSIYESGKMIYDIISRYSEEVKIDYLETIAESFVPTDYDFYIINWHPFTLKISPKMIKAIKARTIAIVMEVDENELLPLTPKDTFDAHMIIDPTKKESPTIYPFPRPLEKENNLLPLYDENKFTVGSFGLLTPGKRFEELVDNANKIGNCIARINLPPVTFMGDVGIQQRLVDYATMLRGRATGDTEVIVTHDYMTKSELIRWCSQNNINVFPYYRHQPGLSAVTDQAIVSERAIGITDCNTFRHMHPYIPHYPEQGYEQLAESTLEGVLKMKKDWSEESFNIAFGKMLLDLKLV